MERMEREEGGRSSPPLSGSKDLLFFGLLDLQFIQEEKKKFADQGNTQMKS